MAVPFILPAGSIVMWVGKAVPVGWALCNGKNGTPNLTDRFMPLEDGTMITYIRKITS
jgi:hypothetical protein